jgi:hypothetical protein
MPNLPRRIREARTQDQGIGWALVRQGRIATQTWTAAVSFGVTLHALFGVALIVSAVQRPLAPTVYDRLSGGHAWAVGILFLAMYAYALAFPVWGGLIAIFVCSAIGLTGAVLNLSIVGIIFYLALPYMAVTTTRKRRKLVAWLQWRRAVYEQGQGADPEAPAGGGGRGGPGE